MHRQRKSSRTYEQITFNLRVFALDEAELYLVLILLLSFIGVPLAKQDTSLLFTVDEVVVVAAVSLMVASASVVDVIVIFSPFHVLSF